jgi:hypothetical protein
MCVTFFYIDNDASKSSPVPYRLILANNRDEVYSRPTGVLAWQPGGLLYGKDFTFYQNMYLDQKYLHNFLCQLLTWSPAAHGWR